jgi:hypothetical protein
VLALADTANDDLVELVPYLLNLRAQGATRCGGFDKVSPLVIGTGRAPHEAGVLEPPAVTMMASSA